MGINEVSRSSVGVYFAGTRNPEMEGDCEVRLPMDLNIDQRSPSRAGHSHLEGQCDALINAVATTDEQCHCQYHLRESEQTVTTHPDSTEPGSASMESSNRHPVSSSIQ